MTKQRNEHVYATTKGDVGQISFSINEQTGEIGFETEMINSYSQVSYERAKGPKVLSRVPQPYAGMTFSQNEAFKNNFEFHCAVDTNTRRIRETMVSVTGVVTARRKTFTVPDGIKSGWQFDVPLCVEMTEVKPPPENLGWIVALERLLDDNLITRTTKIGMVVDSDLGNLQSYNERTKALFGNAFLPPNVILIYASSDAGKENILNHMLSLADSATSQALNAIEKGIVPFNDQRGYSDLFDGHRLIRPRIKTR